jgi:hypothetical protein
MEEFQPIAFELTFGPDGWRYQSGEALSKFTFVHKVDAYRYAIRPQRLTEDNLLVPDTRWSPDLN